MATPDIDLKAEVARVQKELTCFRGECLPAFLGGSVRDFLLDGMSDFLQSHIVAVAGRLSEWRDAAARLADFLPLGPLPLDAPFPGREDFTRFLFQQATPAFTVRSGRVVWRVGLFIDLDMAADGCLRVLGRRDAAAVPSDEFLARLPEVKAWLMGLPVDDSPLWNSLCMVLPAMADADPAFARLALDPETWRALVLADRKITEGQRGKRLRAIDGIFGHVLNNALLHVLGTLANNHFLVIRDYLDHPHLRGSYTHLMPHYLFAVLIEKVRVLRHLSRERHDLWLAQGV